MIFLVGWLIADRTYIKHKKNAISFVCFSIFFNSGRPHSWDIILSVYLHLLCYRGMDSPFIFKTDRWFLGYTCCDACGRLFVKGNYCPVCLKVLTTSPWMFVYVSVECFIILAVFWNELVRIYNLNAGSFLLNMLQSVLSLPLQWECIYYIVFRLTYKG